MFKKIPIYYSLPAIIFSTLLVVAIIFAWTEPTAPPPQDNVPAPINVGTTTQYKAGALGVGGVFRAYSNLYVDGNVGIGTTTPEGRLEVFSSVGDFIYEKEGTFFCETGYSPIAYKTTSRTCGIPECPSCTTGKHDWSPDGNYQESCYYNACYVSLIGCSCTIKCYATPWVRCQKVPIFQVKDVDAIFGGNVGIGTTSPTQRLHVRGNTYISGKVGIGTTKQDERLTVAGMIELETADSGIKFPDGSVRTSGIPAVTVSTCKTSTAGGTYSCTVYCPTDYIRTGCSVGGDSVNTKCESYGSGCRCTKTDGPAGPSATCYAYCLKFY